MFFGLWQYWYKAIQLKHVVSAYSPHYVPMVSTKMRIWYSVLWSNYACTERLQIGETLLMQLWVINWYYSVVRLMGYAAKYPVMGEDREVLLGFIKEIATQLRLYLYNWISTLYKDVSHILATASYVFTTSFLAFYEAMQCKVIENAVQNDRKRSVKYRGMHCKALYNIEKRIAYFRLFALHCFIKRLKRRSEYVAYRS